MEVEAGIMLFEGEEGRKTTQGMQSALSQWNCPLASLKGNSSANA